MFRQHRRKEMDRLKSMEDEAKEVCVFLGTEIQLKWKQFDVDFFYF